MSDFTRTGQSGLTSPKDKRFDLAEILQNKYFLEHQKKLAEAKMKKGLNELGPAIYHHHFHNAIVGSSEPAGRYNAKWLEQQDLEFGQVKSGDFRRGQGGILCRMSRPYNLKNAPDLFIEAE
jgi:hypothetical protein